ncbi:RNA methyltransferase [Pseudonocardia sp. EC080610-09]|uniref:TfoX/Sxy family protein n=1 Tax=unclassified Pseudonocardia TaxID=2619320 RepID=UPI0006CB4E70|nr:MULTISPECIES: TfoX/Sxy family protein [unclassified Pseudonocardia]ALE75477.1 RNA methyltransferase [Pseudonocardia sp. EC080625-04]ALL74851.1 RNA methyltransferase [Pseudonocardia sp. EC080610-09]ALL81874.1 RNA methyltransferase [Pseudonocardia sp. EC080619-01]
MAYDEGLAARIRTLLADEPGLTERRMFGGLAFLLDGHMAVAASGSGGLMVRVDPARSAELLTRRGASRMVMSGRETAGWLRVAGEPDVDDLDGPELAGWVAEGAGFVRTLPPK